jgi:hypothetical protein
MPCCTRAVHDSTAGWWCPVHGDDDDYAELQYENDRAADLDPDWPVAYE